MPNSKFPKLLDYDALKQQFGEEESPATQYDHTQVIQETVDALDFDEENQPKLTGLTGSRLRSYAFAVLTRKEYSKAELIEKLATWAMHREEVITLVEELSAQNYQSDQRVAEIMLSSQKRKGKGPNRIKMSLKTKKIDTGLILEELKETDWVEQAYQLKIKKYGTEIATDPKLKAKQIRFLMYRGFEMGAIMKAINRRVDD